MLHDVAVSEDLHLLGSVHCVWSLENERLQGGKREKRKELSEQEKERDREGEVDDRVSRGEEKELSEGKCEAGGR